MDIWLVGTSGRAFYRTEEYNLALRMAVMLQNMGFDPWLEGIQHFPKPRNDRIQQPSNYMK